MVMRQATGSRRMRRRMRALALSVGAAGVLAGAGCNLLGFAGAMVENERRHSTRPVNELYQGLKGKQWAVLVITERLSDPKNQQSIGAAGYIPADRLLKYLYENPRWMSMPRADLAKELGVERLIVVEVMEYRLHDPGNQYLWAGVATGTVGVIEADSKVPDEFSFEKPVKVTFPDKDGYGPNDLPTEAVTTELAHRFVDRVTWMFYLHEEPYYPKY